MKSGPLSRKGLKSWKRGCRNNHAAHICQYACVLKHIYRNNVRQHFKSIGPALVEWPPHRPPRRRGDSVADVGANPTIATGAIVIRCSISLLRGLPLTL